MRKILVLTAFFILAGASVYACEMNYTIIDSSGHNIQLSPDKPAVLKVDQKYKLIVDFTENHRKCTVSADKTVFLLNDEKWIYGKDSVPFIINNDYFWESIKSGKYSAEILFTAAEKGEISLEVLRDCSRKEGYDEYLNFTVS